MHGACGRRLDAADDLDQRGFARAVLAQDRYLVAHADVEADAVQNASRPNLTVVRFYDVAYDDTPERRAGGGRLRRRLACRLRRAGLPRQISGRLRNTDERRF